MKRMVEMEIFRKGAERGWSLKSGICAPQDCSRRNENGRRASGRAVDGKSRLSHATGRRAGASPMFRMSGQPVWQPVEGSGCRRFSAKTRRRVGRSRHFITRPSRAPSSTVTPGRRGSRGLWRRLSGRRCPAARGCRRRALRGCSRGGAGAGASMWRLCPPA